MAVRSKKIWRQRPDLEPLMKKAIHLFPTTLGHIDRKRILLVSFACRRSKHVARVTPNKRPFSILTENYDYAIEFHESAYDGRPEEFKMYVMVHELLHIPVDGTTPGTRSNRKTLDHDIKDFKDLRIAYGIRLENMSDVLKGEKHLLKGYNPKKIQRFPRLPEIK